jgi:hypothetical protein
LTNWQFNFDLSSASENLFFQQILTPLDAVSKKHQPPAESIPQRARPVTRESSANLSNDAAKKRVSKEFSDDDMLRAMGIRLDAGQSE